MPGIPVFYAVDLYATFETIKISSIVPKYSTFEGVFFFLFNWVKQIQNIISGTWGMVGSASLFKNHCT